MTPLLLRRSRLATASLSMLTLLLAACGASSDTDADIPEFVGPLGVSPGVAPGVVAPASPGSPEPGDGPGGTNTPAPGAEEVGNDPLPLDMTPSAPAVPGEAPSAPTPEATPEAPEAPVTEEPPVPQDQPERPASPDRPTRGTANLFTELLDIPATDVDDKVRTAVERVFGIGTNESTVPVVNAGYRIYYELPQDPSQAFIWCADANDVRSEGQSYGMMIAVQMNMQAEFNKLWKFAKQQMQFSTNDAWNRYFRWQGQVNASANNITVNFGQNGPAPDGDEYFAAALYLADRRWGSNGGVNYEQEADAIASAMLRNTGNGQGRTAIIDAQSNMVVFFPQGNSAMFSDPSYHLPAFYEIFAQDGDPADSNRWRQIADVSRQYFVSSANANTGLHPDYANFNGTPNTGGGGQTHDQFRYDAWRVPMNMAVDYAWTGADARLQTQVEKYHQFFGSRLGDNNVRNALYQLNGNVAGDDSGSSTALTATLASGALASNAANRAEFVDNLWNVPQQSGTYRYYQESVYLLGLLATAGWFGYEWAPPAQ
jgi:oligosaccharide reducing-end xylanase